MLSSINKNLTRTPTRASILSSLLNSCIARSATDPGKQVHAQLILSGLSRNPFSATKLITLYSASHSTSNARAVFDGIPNRDRNVFVYNAMIRAYAWHGPHEHAISLFQTMVENGLEPDNFTYPFALKACSALSALKDGKGIHHERAVMSCWDSDPFVGAALVDMYSKCGSVDSARDAFDRVTDRDVVVWNSMIAAYAHNGLPTEAFEILREMSTRGFRPTVATLVTTIATAADAAMLPQGREIHGHGVRMGFVSQDKVNTALVDMYAKSGRLGVARTVFERLKERRNVSWNAIITGYAMHGNAEEALNLFDRMRSERFEPDHITYVGVLAACSRGGFTNPTNNISEVRWSWNLALK
ncbi:Pentatricopeptide repeat-containing protein [Acorus calamus]|uniref:Pentatricopeptide repeat-containing protein n=1 Tax=Acorus calamus TaxID=4465 RepID=A0AAV9CA15_ACOCL|nr:Pentatricopeptide repeat-containing protein [Acorus calamus]